MTMTFSDQAALARQDGRVTDDPTGGRPARPKRRGFARHQFTDAWARYCPRQETAPGGER